MLSPREDRKRFTRSLETGRPYRTTILGDGYPISARAMGIISVPQFTMMARPSEYHNSWLHMDEPQVRQPNMTHYPDFIEEGDEHYAKVEQDIMKNGVIRPVLLGPKRNMLIPSPTGSGARTPAHPVLDGHHRAFLRLSINCPFLCPL
jgi:hypothetical protein